MESWTGLAIGILGSFVATVIYAIIAIVLSSRFKKQFRIAMNKLIDTGVSYIYDNQAHAVVDIGQCFRRSKMIKVFTLRGSSFFSDIGDLKCLIEDLQRWQELFLLMADNTPPESTNFAQIRAHELETIDKQSIKQFLDEIASHIGIARMKCADNKRLTVRLHNVPAVFRLIIFDDDLFVLFYSSGSRAARNQVYRCPANSELYKSLARYFDLVWKYSSRDLPAS